MGGLSDNTSDSPFYLTSSVYDNLANGEKQENLNFSIQKWLSLSLFVYLCTQHNIFIWQNEVTITESG